ncbi:leucine-rich repeat-containing protein 71 isoform X8 [Aquila chrysaetos chrysaetos]|uniref:leucine-rich repeat-containing protein 71 isoform X8 n=1 Tax=Aquila chrysaetos chrysaetos TaxID=223781 RepID=UPI001B7D43B3|nr:leucine-rich repeat-containing protein 71 isoform X8 [Aquila chrysaetos chrysaetos]
MSPPSCLLCLQRSTSAPASWSRTFLSSAPGLASPASPKSPSGHPRASLPMRSPLSYRWRRSSPASSASTAASSPASRWRGSTRTPGVSVPSSCEPLEGWADRAAAPCVGGGAGTLSSSADAQPGGKPLARACLPHADGERQHCRQQSPGLHCPSCRLAHLSLRNNSIGDAAARLIGQSLSTLSSSNRSLVSLVLSFNRISDLGAGYIAKGLRLNRSLLSLSLANNDIGDAGATRLAEVLGPFALTHGEVVERRRLLLVEALGRFRMTPKETEEQRERPSSLRGSMAPDKLPPAKHGKTPTKKKEPLRREEARQSKKPPELRAAHSRDAKLSGQEKPSPEGPPCVQVPDPAKQLHPLLEARQHQGSIILPGNRALLNLNLTHNHITERGLGAFLAVLEGQQREKKPKMPGQQGLLCLSLEVSQVGDGARIAMGQGLMPRFPTEEPHPSHQPSLRAAPGAAAAAAGPPPQNPGPRGGAGIGHLAGPRGAAQAPTGEGELASCLFFKKNKKEIKTFTVKRRKINQMIQHRTATGQS